MLGAVAGTSLGVSLHQVAQDERRICEVAREERALNIDLARAAHITGVSLPPPIGC